MLDNFTTKSKGKQKFQIYLFQSYDFVFTNLLKTDLNILKTYFFYF